MNDIERDRLIMETHDAVVSIMPMVQDHHLDLYGDRNGNKGMKSKLVLLEERQESHPKNCPGAQAASLDNKRYGIATVMMVVAIIGIIISTLFGILNYLKQGVSP